MCGDEAACEALRRRPVDLVVAELRAPGSDGLALLRRIRSGEAPRPWLPVIVVAARSSLSAAVAAGRLGASDFLPLSGDGVARLVERATALLAHAGAEIPDALVGTSRAVRDLRARAAALGGLELPVLVHGPPDAGHEAVAAYLHARSPRGAHPFSRHEAGAGSARLELSGTGTLHVAGAERLAADEQQALRAELRGSETSARGERARLVVSAGEDPRGSVEAGRLDAELFERLARFRLALPALRERRADLPALLERFLERAAARLGRPAPTVTASAAERLGRHPWPRNLRDLARVAELLVALAPGTSVPPETAEAALAELEAPLERIGREREREERGLLLELYRRHGTYTGVARELGLTRNAARYRFAKHGLIPAPPNGPRGGAGPG